VTRTTTIIPVEPGATEGMNDRHASAEMLTPASPSTLEGAPRQFTGVSPRGGTPPAAQASSARTNQRRGRPRTDR
jgi:hypothetical protein